MKAEIFKKGYTESVIIDSRIISESDFQKLVTLMKELRETDKEEVINNYYPRTLSVGSRIIVNDFLNLNGFKEDII